MEPEQKNLMRNFPALIDALVGKDANGQLPSLRVGVISTDVLANPQSALLGLPKDSSGDCPRPLNPWIAYYPETGTHNLEGGTGDAIQDVKDAFSCLAKRGITGYGFEQPLETAWRALDPGRNSNPGFLRKDAMLAIVII